MRTALLLGLMPARAARWALVIGNNYNEQIGRQRNGARPTRGAGTI